MYKRSYGHLNACTNILMCWHPTNGMQEQIFLCAGIEGVKVTSRHLYDFSQKIFTKSIKVKLLGNQHKHGSITYITLSVLQNLEYAQRPK